jgi:hypothetical protein
MVGGVDLDTFPSHQGDDQSEEIQRDLEEALASVPDRQREALLLREWRGLSCPEIAEALDLSEPATHALLTRARRSLAQALTAAGRRPVLGLDLPGLLSQLRSVFAGTAAKSAATVVAAAGLGLGGVAVERAIDSGPTSRPARESPVTQATAATATPGNARLVAGAGHRTARTDAHVAGSAISRAASTRPRTRGPHLPPAETQPATASAPPRSDVLPRAATPVAIVPGQAGAPTVQPQLPVSAPTLPSVDPPGLDVPALPSLPDPTTPAVEVPPATVGDVTTPSVTVPSATVPVSDVTDSVQNLLP